MKATSNLPQSYYFVALEFLLSIDMHFCNKFGKYKGKSNQKYLLNIYEYLLFY